MRMAEGTILMRLRGHVARGRSESRVVLALALPMPSGRPLYRMRTGRAFVPSRALDGATRRVDRPDSALRRDGAHPRMVVMAALGTYPEHDEAR